MKSVQKLTAVASPRLIQEYYAAANTRLLFHAWWAIFTIAALLQIALWPDKVNIVSVLFAWSSCIVTGLVMMRGRVTFSNPWSSFMVLMFCLTTCGLPLVILIFQGDSLSKNLEVPTSTFLHLLVCQILLLLVHTFYRSMNGLRRIQEGFRNYVIRPLGFFALPRFGEIMTIGAVGLAASTFIYLFLRDQQGGELKATGPVIEKLIQGLCPLSYTPFLLLFPGVTIQLRGGKAFRFVGVIVYSLPVLFIAMAFNARTYAFIGVAVAGITGVLMVISGQFRLVIGKTLVLVGVGLLLIVTVGGDIAAAMRVARAGRTEKSSIELAEETFQLLTKDRQELKQLRQMMNQREDQSEAWYVTNPVFSRLVNTHFQDKALAIGSEFGEREKQTIRLVETEKILSTLPNPMLQMFDIQISKNEVAQYSMGAWMESLSNREEESLTGRLASGGFIGDGFAAYGWGYLLPFGFVALVLFIFSDSLYGSPAVQAANDGLRSSSFAIVGLVNAYGLAIVLTSESIAELISFTIRQPLQWLVLYGVVFWVVRFTVNMLTRKVPKSAWDTIPHPLETRVHNSEEAARKS